jgi:hypothetical protein
MEIDESDFLKIKDAIDQGVTFFVRRDEMNAAVHLGEVRYSPLTSRFLAARDRMTELWTPGPID